MDVSELYRIIDTEAFQALRERKQLGVNSLVFPGAVHTRFEHSIGVLSLAQRLCRIHGITGNDARHIQAFALLHDIGHGPFSHQTEPVLQGSHHRQG
ncbi:MAG: HD domain-containing protein, partial [Victivallales bacterium]|nr:HD domain-containing protein [Victivallales bacterium]